MDLLFEELKENGVNVDEGIERVMGNAGLYRQMLFMLLDMLEGFSPQRDFDSSNCPDVIEKVHKIKGATGNLAVQPLYHAYMKALELLRANQPEQAEAVLLEIQPVQEKIMACIEKYK